MNYKKSELGELENSKIFQIWYFWFLSIDMIYNHKIAHYLILIYVTRYFNVWCKDSLSKTFFYFIKRNLLWNLNLIVVNILNIITRKWKNELKINTFLIVSSLRAMMAMIIKMLSFNSFYSIIIGYVDLYLTLFISILYNYIVFEKYFCSNYTRWFSPDVE